MLVILGTLLAFSLLGNIAAAVYLCIRRKPNNGLMLIKSVYAKSVSSKYLIYYDQNFLLYAASSQTWKLLSDKVVHCNDKGQ